LITARQAAELGREVFAIPGSIHNPMARGCHQLIREGALLIEHVQDVLVAIGPAAQRLGTTLKARLQQNEETGSGRGLAPPSEDPDYQRLRAALGHDPVALDVLSARSGLTVAALSSMLLLLELEGIVHASHGRYSLRMT
jgi:DNA processing protein